MTLRHLLPLLAVASLHAEDINWQLQFDGKALPDAKWSPVGTPSAKLDADGLLVEDEGDGLGHYRATWKAADDEEIIVEAEVKVGTTTGSQKKKPSTSSWPWRDGAPVVV